jgi:hypothetical protein
MDTWREENFNKMKVGGNKNCHEFFIKYGIDDLNMDSKYNSRAAKVYKEKILALAKGLQFVDPDPSELQKPSSQSSSPNLSRSSPSIKRTSDHDDFYSGGNKKSGYNSRDENRSGFQRGNNNQFNVSYNGNSASGGYNSGGGYNTDRNNSERSGYNSDRNNSERSGYNSDRNNSERGRNNPDKSYSPDGHNDRGYNSTGGNRGYNNNGLHPDKVKHPRKFEDEEFKSERQEDKNIVENDVNKNEKKGP